MWYIFAQREYPKKYPTTGTAVIALGDSLVVGEGVLPGNDFVSILSERLDVPIINAGRAGDTTAETLRRLETDVLARDPRIVIILVGGNDAIRRIPKQETFSNLAKIIDKIQARGAAVLLVGIQSGFFRDNYKNDFYALSRKKGAWHVPDILDGIFGHGQLMQDTIHPNDKGYLIIADRIEPVLRNIIR
ncbi:MAG: hypothetical protein A3C07_04520 [Candidatus Sungbacteria bacterium RIFCSPHIGHO2_02_FULL_47_11]|uniref:SGNH hydrolase-type esterase domain-containing protein n=1 Tax=Candidatus Sungbacteria bacterium RIFCSPHIGHO2_02_FULL_47_11 TaxID=1802270 RepID=A0A1G2KIC1_9BACT|nr:MAG: hypothetical protein A3C07_04520 [Candidatus Sungbacteria bacterium RIFCSPHIGHO2_02_FULL_47_11]